MAHATYTVPMLDHVVLNVSDYDRSRTFYEQALAPLGFSLLREPRPGAGGFGTEGKPSFWISDQRRPVSENVHVAFTVQDRATVDAFHATAVQAGGTDNGAPGRPGDLPPHVLRRLRARSRRHQHRGGLPRACMTGWQASASDVVLPFRGVEGRPRGGAARERLLLVRSGTA